MQQLLTDAAEYLGDDNPWVQLARHYQEIEVRKGGPRDANDESLYAVAHGLAEKEMGWPTERPEWGTAIWGERARLILRYQTLLAEKYSIGHSA